MRPTKQAVYSSRIADKFVVRLPDGMRERIADVAREHHRSMNSEIIARLERSLNENVKEDVGSTAEVIDVIDPWNPVKGMAVTLREGEYRGQPLIIKDLAFDGGVLIAKVVGEKGPGAELVSDLMPFLVK